jgi:hypothetical protein
VIGPLERGHRWHLLMQGGEKMDELEQGNDAALRDEWQSRMDKAFDTYFGVSTIL